MAGPHGAKAESSLKPPNTTKTNHHPSKPPTPTIAVPWNRLRIRQIFLGLFVHRHQASYNGEEVRQAVYPRDVSILQAAYTSFRSRSIASRKKRFRIEDRITKSMGHSNRFSSASKKPKYWSASTRPIAPKRRYPTNTAQKPHNHHPGVLEQPKKPAPRVNP